MIVLFEGVDGGGKTTLLSQLLKTFPGSQELTWPGRASTPSEFLAKANMFIHEHKNKVTSGELYFVDRCGIGEFMYGPLQEGREMTTYSCYAAVFQKWLKDKLIVICMTDNMHDAAIKRGETGIAKDPEIHKLIAAGYRNLDYAAGRELNLHHYNWKDPEAYTDLVGAILVQRLREVMNYDSSK